METEEFIHYQELYSDWYEDFPEYFHIDADLEKNNNSIQETNSNQLHAEQIKSESTEALIIVDPTPCTAELPNPSPSSDDGNANNDDGAFIDLCQLFWQIMPQDCVSFFEENLNPHLLQGNSQTIMQFHQTDATQPADLIRVPGSSTTKAPNATFRTGNLPELGKYTYYEAGYRRIAVVQKDLRHGNRKNFICTFPGCTFITRKKAHRYRQYCSLHDPRSRPIFICAVCSEEFRSDPELQKHIEAHTKGKAFQCSLCHFKGAKESSLTRHLKSKHGEEVFGQLQLKQN